MLYFLYANSRSKYFLHFLSRHCKSCTECAATNIAQITGKLAADLEFVTQLFDTLDVFQMEREIPIKIIGHKDEPIKKNDFFKRDLPPLVTFTDDSGDEDDGSESGDGFSIEELESALFSDTEEGLDNHD